MRLSSIASAFVDLVGTEYVGTDDEPAQLGTVAAYLAGGTDAPTPPAVDPSAGHGKRLSNARLRATGWVPQFPTFREGYARNWSFIAGTD